MRAAVLHEPGKRPPLAQSRPLVIEEVDLDPPGPGEILVRIVAAGLCHSDLSAILGDRPRVVPAVLGHEAAGVVEDVGGHVDGLAAGDHVVLVFVASCGHCVQCAQGRRSLCETAGRTRGQGTLHSGVRRLRLGGGVLHHYGGISAFAEYAVVSTASAVRIDPEVPLLDAALFGCAVLTGVGAVVNTAGMPAGATAAVVGLGGVGLCALMGARLSGASRLVAVDTNPKKLTLAASLGATDVFDARDPGCREQVVEATSGGVEFAFDMTGVPKAFELAVSLTRRGGVTVTAGLPRPEATAAVPLAALVADERTIRGSYMGSCVPCRDVPRFLALYRRGLLPVGQLRSGSLPLEGLNAGFDRMLCGESVRDVLEPGAPARTEI
jgi:alcohol dehydrogenase